MLAAQRFIKQAIYKGPLSVLQQLSHLESRQKVEDLISDSFGNYHEQNPEGSAYERKDPKEIEHEKFARQLAKVLYRGHTQNQYHQLIIVAKAHFYGLLKKHLSKAIPNVSHLNKEYINPTEKELLHQLQEHCRMHSL